MPPHHLGPTLQRVLDIKIDYADAVSDVLTTVLNALKFQ
jgi:hypothetical protein